MRYTFQKFVNRYGIKKMNFRWWGFLMTFSFSTGPPCTFLVNTVAWYYFFHELHISSGNIMQSCCLKILLEIVTNFLSKHILKLLFETIADNSAYIQRNYNVKMYRNAEYCHSDSHFAQQWSTEGRRIRPELIFFQLLLRLRWP